MNDTCAECGATISPGEYHPYAFCVLHKAGLDPWQEIRLIAAQLQLGALGKHPPHLIQIH